MDWTKLPGFAKTAMAAARIVAAGAVGMAALASALLIVGPALPGHVAPLWVSAQPRIQAIGIGECNKLAQLYRINPDTPVPPGCVNRGGFKGLLPPPGDTPPPPPGDAPPPPGDAP
jgi:hypothetical protein